MKERLVFSSVDEAIQHLANITQKRILVANLEGPVTADEKEEEDDAVQLQ
jgi:hypothetical protein